MGSATNDTNTNAVRVDAPKRDNDVVSTAGYTQDEKYAVKLITELLDEAGKATAPGKPTGTQEEKQAIAKVQQAWRKLWELRGDAFMDAFGVFVTSATKYSKGLFSLTTINRFMESFPDQSEREVYLIFINNVARFAKSQNKADYGQRNNIDRLIRRLVDNDLKQLVAHAFNVI
ncbi:hypothetical protein KWAN_55 [Erwinia phage vB_EamM_Kwan]|uniref:Uncharacterized protein n=1 Tax=Erwinia phage vB_EamM_Kwan TaxID=1883374 RepID=A0A1B2IDP2_9CAUD|nr:hypothetical protein BIZ80_gp244 [Erwinia phage vB_EamM_Kwan]ANZ49407.1 hypothetical protein KWAN_55 [Erwinia phage vB_EamM_Kwan]